jgi:hypothetical protein
MSTQSGKSSKSGLYTDHGRERVPTLDGFTNLKSKKGSKKGSASTTIEEIEVAVRTKAPAHDVCMLLYKGRRLGSDPGTKIRYLGVLREVAKRFREVGPLDLTNMWKILSGLGYQDRAAMPPIAQYVYDSLVQISLIRTRTRRFSTREIAETLRAMAKSESSNAVLQLALFELAAEKVITITPQDIAMTLHAASRLELPTSALERCFVDSLGPHMAKVVHTFNPQDLSMCLLAIALLQLPIERVVGLLPGPCPPLSASQILASLCACVLAADVRTSMTYLYTALH